jgi:type IV pilus assembly protein PilM
MSIVRRIFPSATDALRPRLACEITPLGVLAGRPGNVAIAGEAQDVMTSFAPLRMGTLTPGLKSPNMTDRAAVASALRQALEPVAERERKVSLVVPDATVRVMLLDFDTLPAKATEAVPILRFRLRKLVPFDVEDAAVSYQVIHSAPGDSLVRALVAVMPGAVRTEYEDAVREAGYEPGAVLSSSLAALAAVPGDGASLIVNRNSNSITTAIVRGNNVLLYRTVDLGERGLDPELGEAQATLELQQTVSVALAYFEDTLASSPEHLFCVGLGGAAELARLLSDDTIRIRDLVPAPAKAGGSEQAPSGLLAPLVGALAS